jgi:hypothetical protein
MTHVEWLCSLFPSGGFFVEAGAHDGIGDSTTYALEKAGWFGLCVEPSRAFAGLKQNRKCKVDDRCLWNRDDGLVGFMHVDGNQVELSGIVECFGDHWNRAGYKHSMTTRPTVTLTTLLYQHLAPVRIEFLSLDTEGSEFQILDVHDFDRYRFLTMSVEHNRVEAKRQAVRGLLFSKGYRLSTAVPADVEDYFIHESVQVRT